MIQPNASYDMLLMSSHISFMPKKRQEASRLTAPAFIYVYAEHLSRTGKYVPIHMKSLYKVVGQLSKPLAYLIESHIWSLLAPIQTKSCNQFEHYSKSLV